MRVKSKQNTPLATLLHEFATPSSTHSRSSSIDGNLRISQSPSYYPKRKVPQQMVDNTNPQDSPLGLENNNDLSTLTTKKNNTLDLISDWLVNSSASLTYEQILTRRAGQQQESQQEHPLQESVVLQFSKPSRNIFFSNLESQHSFNASSTSSVPSQKRIPKEDLNLNRREQQSQISTLPLINSRQTQQKQENINSTEIPSNNNKRHKNHSSSLPPTLPSLKQSDLPIHQSLEKKLPLASGKVSPIPQSGSFITNPLNFSSLSRQRLLMSIPSYSIQTSDTSDPSENTPKHSNSSSTKQSQQHEESSPLTPNSKLHNSTKGQILKWTESSPSNKALKLSSSVLSRSPTNIETTLPALSGSFTANLISKPRSDSSELSNLKILSSRNTDVSNQTKPSLFSNVANKAKNSHRNNDREEQTQSSSSSTNQVEEAETIQSKRRCTSIIEDEETVQLHDAWNLLSPKVPQGNSDCKIKSILKIQLSKKLNMDDSLEHPINRINQLGQKSIIPQSFSQTRANSLQRIRQEDNDTPKTTKTINSLVIKQNSLGDFSEFFAKKKCVNFRETLQIIHIDKNNKDVVEKVHRSDRTLKDL